MLELNFTYDLPVTLTTSSDKEFLQDVKIYWIS